MAPLAAARASLAISPTALTAASTSDSSESASEPVADVPPSPARSAAVPSRRTANGLVSCLALFDFLSLRGVRSLFSVIDAPVAASAGASSRLLPGRSSAPDGTSRAPDVSKLTVSWRATEGEPAGSSGSFVVSAAWVLTASIVHRASSSAILNRVLPRRITIARLTIHRA